MSPRSVSSRSPSPRPDAGRHDPGDAADVLWREWRNTEDADLAGALFALVADLPARHRARRGWALWWALLGAGCGVLATTVLGNLDLLDLGLLEAWRSPPGLAGPAGAIGGAAVVGGPVLRSQPRESWRCWFERFPLPWLHQGQVVRAAAKLLVAGLVAYGALALLPDPGVQLGAGAFLGLSLGSWAGRRTGPSARSASRSARASSSGSRPGATGPGS